MVKLVYDALARDVFGHVPKAWWLTIPAVKMEFNEALTPEVQRGMNEGVGRIVGFTESRSCGASAERRRLRG